MEQSNHRTGIVIMNLGSPNSTAVADVKTYLDEFLMDKKVIDYPYLFRYLLVRGIITPRRSPKSAEAYKTVWWPEGSPLIVITERLRQALEQRSGLPVEVAMRYGDPHPSAAYDRLLERVPDLQEVLLIPMYPHYAMSSYETAAAYAQKVYRKGQYPFALTTLGPFYDHPEYIDVLAGSIRPYLKEKDYLLFSYHGVPVRHIRKGDVTGTHCLNTTDCCCTDSEAHAFCYRHQVITTAHLTAKALGLQKQQYGISFQSRLGREEWLQPYTAATLEALPAKGVKDLVVACPAFTADCLETLEEIAVEGRDTFLKAGGQNYTTTACLNDNPAWVDLLNKWIQQRLSGSRAMLMEKEMH